MSSVTQDPQDVLDYSISYAELLPGTDSIVSSTWTDVDDGLVISRESIAEQSVIFWLSVPGGAAGQKYSATNHVVTAEGRELDQTITVRLRDN